LVPPLIRLVISLNAAGVATSASSLRPFFDQKRPAALNATLGFAALGGSARRSTLRRSPKR
jgi:hypothetical protein